ncbi:MAG: hypothetical protein J5I50_08315 [Chitinophagaceae bacterium]|nr:hypothetical protein [Chitinophagaceae bacterium]
MKSPLLYIAIFLCSVTVSNATPQHFPYKDTITLKKLWKQISKENTFPVEEVVLQKDNRIPVIKQQATAFDLLKTVMEHQNAVVRLYAFAALSDQMDNLPAEIIKKVREDTSPVNVIRNGELKTRPFNEVANGFLK